MPVYLFSAQSSDQIWHYLYTKERIYMMVYSHNDKYTPTAVRYWIHRDNEVIDVYNFNPLWSNYITSSLNIIDIIPLSNPELHQLIDDTITLRMLESI